jgi:hypothetical protein
MAQPVKAAMAIPAAKASAKKLMEGSENFMTLLLASHMGASELCSYRGI